MIPTNLTQLMGKRLKIKIPDNFWKALAVLGLSTLPYLSTLLPEIEGEFLKYSSFEVFFFFFTLNLFTLIGFWGWYRNSRDKYYKPFIAVPLASSIYHMGLILFQLRGSFLNDPILKYFLLYLFFLIIYIHIYRFKKAENKKRILFLFLISIISICPFFHDLITLRDGSVRASLPFFDIEALLTDENGMVRGLSSYRVLLYLFFIQLFSHLAYIGWFFGAVSKKYRTFLLLPLALSFYQLVIITMSWKETNFNDPTVILLIIIVFCILLAVNFYFNNKIITSKDINKQFNLKDLTNGKNQQETI